MSKCKVVYSKWLFDVSKRRENIKNFVSCYTYNMQRTHFNTFLFKLPINIIRNYGYVYVCIVLYKNFKKLNKRTHTECEIS